MVFKSLCLIARGFILFSLPQHLLAQTNLVPNPSFETNSQCPDAQSQIPRATPWAGPVINSTDYFNVCATNTALKVPLASAYFQPARTGDAYIGLYMLEASYMNSREYAQVQLLSSLQSGKCYYVEFYISLQNVCRYGVNNAAAYLSSSALSTTGTDPLLNVTPQITNYKNPIVTDTLNWVRVSGIYKAQGGENYITIGNFKDDDNTDTLFVNQSMFNSAYYYIDDVSVIEINGGFEPATTYRDTTINEGDSVFIGTRMSGVNCTWHKTGVQIADSVPGITVAPTTTTTYTLMQKIPCSSNIKLDTVVVTVKPIVGIKTNELLKAEIYPNPSSGVFNIHTPNTTADISVYNILGVLVKTLRSTGGKTAIDLNNEANGLYFLKISDPATNEVIIKKLSIKE
jgi:hypothetical protein